MASLRHSGGIAETVQTLAERLRRLDRARRPAWKQTLSSGIRALDQLLPDGGFHQGTLVEWLAGGVGSGAATLALLAAGQAARQGGAVVVIDRQRRFYPVAAVNLGIDPGRLIVVRPTNAVDHAWAFDQALAAHGVAAVWGEVQEQTDHTLRRWQLAAEASGVLGLLLRDQEARGQPSWAELRLWVEPIVQHRNRRSRRLRVELLRSHGGQAGRSTELEIPGQGCLQELQEPQQEPIAGQKRSGRPGDMKYETRDVHLAPSLAAAEAESKKRRGRRRA